MACHSQCSFLVASLLLIAQLFKEKPNLLKTPAPATVSSTTVDDVNDESDEDERYFDADDEKKGQEKERKTESLKSGWIHRSGKSDVVKI